MVNGMLSAQGTFQLYIDGQFVGNRNGKTFPVCDPSTEEILAEVMEASAVEGDILGLGIVFAPASGWRLAG